MKCAICGVDSGWMRCDKHNVCDGCGTRGGLCHRRGGLWCDDCHEKRAQKEVAEFDGDTECTDEITCPWCGNEQRDSWEESDSDTHVCDNCGNEYTHERECVVTYSTTKIGGRQ